MRLLRTSLVATLALVALHCSVTVAAPRKPRETKEAKPEQKEAKEQARAAYQRATKHYNLNEYAEALADYKDAYRLYEDSSFLFNIAQCQRQLGTKLEAVRSYRSFLRSAPHASNRVEVERLMTELEAEMREESKGRPPLGTISPDTPSMNTGGSEEAKPATTTSNSSNGTTTVEVTASTPVYKRWWLWTAIVVVVAAGALAVGLSISATSVSYPSVATTAGTFSF